MATLKDKLEEMARIKGELQRMETSEETTEENDGDYRDTLVQRWKQLDDESKPIIERMDKIKAITRMADDDDNLERPDGDDGGGAWRGGTPDLVTRRFRDPYDNPDAVRNRVVYRSELLARAQDAIEIENKRGNLNHDHAEAATLHSQNRPDIARHMLLTGSQEYQEAFRMYLEDPQGNAQRAALALTTTNGGYLLPFVLDQLVA